MADVDKWIEELNRALSGHAPYPLEIDSLHQPEWDFYKDFLSGIDG